MKRRFEYQPGLFGLASIAAGCAAKSSKRRPQEDSALAFEQGQKSSQSAPENRKSFRSIEEKRNRGR